MTESFQPPEFVEMPKSIRTAVTVLEDGSVGIDFTYSPPGRDTQFTMRMPLSREDAIKLAAELGRVG